MEFVDDVVQHPEQVRSGLGGDAVADDGLADGKGNEGQPET